jgi:hypothetical protein
MTRTDMITIRISTEERLLYEAEAAYRKQSLSAYLRERLEKRETPSHDQQNLQDLLKNIPQSSSREKGILLEILLLLRYMAGTEKLVIVRKDLERLNIPTWQGDSFSKE